MSPTPPAHAVGRTAAVLRAVSAAEPDGRTTAEVGRATGLARPTAHRLLTALQAEGLVDRAQATGRWLLGPELYLLGAAAQPRYDVTDHAGPVVRRLAEATGESAFFSALRGEETVCLLREDGSFPLRSHVLHVGIRFPLGVASAGLAMLAYLPDDEITEFLARTDLTAYGESHAPEEVRRRVRRTRRDGYALNPGLLVEGSWGMGSAVFDAEERPRWALSLTGVERRFDPARRRELGPLLLREAHELGRRLRTAGR
ncbi:IclR family transcriptional regulator [Nocardioides massiliensis]|uniref:DNA-binding IclR family transcriptional regulator n=1 Tax=Nocardioides massiliensis TaxID=1325935 RepID=A0ABT9NKP1_9ACTN|nr:IclR family transcriptional regulator [Nocardioides massiliensis]MDP9820991.1 DNA-binding IclR family transcriptional regulator [Nocardioides massiliensis]